MINAQDLASMVAAGGDVIGTDGAKIGGIGRIYNSQRTSDPAWVTVKIGLFGSNESLVPLEAATRIGNDIVVPYTKDMVKDAPDITPGGNLSPEEEDELYTYYGLTGGAPPRR
jgi:hypothetical protein